MLIVGVGPGGEVPQAAGSGGFQPVPSGFAESGLETRAEYIEDGMDVQVVGTNNIESMRDCKLGALQTSMNTIAARAPLSTFCTTP